MLPLTVTDASRKLARWRIRLVTFALEVIQRPGVKHQAVGALSYQQTRGSDETELYDAIPVLNLSIRRFYIYVSIDTDELTEEEGADTNTAFQSYLPEGSP